MEVAASEYQNEKDLQSRIYARILESAPGGGPCPRERRGASRGSCEAIRKEEALFRDRDRFARAGPPGRCRI